MAITASSAAGLTSSTSDRRTWPAPSGTKLFMRKIVSAVRLFS